MEFLDQTTFLTTKYELHINAFFPQPDNGLLGKKKMMKWNEKSKTENMQSVLKQFKNTNLPVIREHIFVIEVLELESEI